VGVQVADFGLSRNISENTMTGGLGTFQWMAPEVLGHQRYSERADVYSFGIVLWECVTPLPTAAGAAPPLRVIRTTHVGSLRLSPRRCVSRKLPYADMNGWQAAMAVMTRGLRPTVPPQTPAPLAKLIQSCWAAVPTDRPLFPHVVNQLETILDQLENRTPRHHQPLPSAV
jgi:serine/threonine protein kinase